jgi:hypothetical protein
LLGLNEEGWHDAHEKGCEEEVVVAYLKTKISVILIQNMNKTTVSNFNRVLRSRK